MGLSACARYAGWVVRFDRGFAAHFVSRKMGGGVVVPRLAPWGYRLAPATWAGWFGARWEKQGPGIRHQGLVPSCVGEVRAFPGPRIGTWGTHSFHLGRGHAKQLQVSRLGRCGDLARDDSAREAAGIWPWLRRARYLSKVGTVVHGSLRRQFTPISTGEPAAAVSLLPSRAESRVAFSPPRSLRRRARATEKRSDRRAESRPA